MKFFYKDALIKETEIQTAADSLSSYRERLAQIATHIDYADDEASIQLPFDDALLDRVQELAKAIQTPTLQYVVVIGIGGSNLGTMAVYDAIAGSMNLLVDRLPKLLFLDTVSDDRMTGVVRELTHMPTKDDFAIISVSKSGKTTEVIANTEVLWKKLNDHFGDVSDRITIITMEESKLWTVIEKRGLKKMSIPKKVGGRYSVFSAVGLLPLLLAKINLDHIREGARDAVKDGTSDELKTNHSIVSAILTHLHAQNGRIIHNSFLFAPKLEALGKWYRQLMGESIGKEQDVDGNTVNAGITPTVSIGSTDLHSMAQLYYGGPDDKFTNIIYSFKGDINLIPNNLQMPGVIENVQGKSLEQLAQAIVGGVKVAYASKNRPFIEIDLQGVSPYELGYYLQFRMIEMMYLAELMHLNAFNQPAVETYKEATRTLLSK
jgi:glucose-6-phosphate isomerase